MNLKYNKWNIWRLSEFYRTEINKNAPIASQYEETMRREIEAIDPYFTRGSLNNMLEIGPGMGVFSALAHKKYGPYLYMIEGGKKEDRPDVMSTVGWKGDQPLLCSDVEALSSFMFDNDILDFEILEVLGNGRFRVIADDKPEIDECSLDQAWPLVKFDLVVSLRSWCWHYDASMYLDFVYKHSIPRHTLLLVDVRRFQNQMEKLHECFETVEVIPEKDVEKMIRVLLRAK